MIVGFDATTLSSDGALLLQHTLINEISRIYKTERIVIWGSNCINKSEFGFGNKLIEKDFSNKVHRFIWQCLFLSKEAKNEKCERLISLGGYYPGKFKRFSVVVQNLLPLDKQIIKIYPFQPRLKLNLLHYLQIKSIRKSDHVFLLSKHSKIYLGPSLEDKKVVYINFSISVKKFCGKPLIKQDTVNLLYVANITGYKNHRRLAEAVRQLYNEGIKIKLTLIGRNIGNESDKILDVLKKINGKDGFIEYLGFIEHEKIWKHYSEADIIVYPSLVESLGIPIYEALLLEKPILCSKLIDIVPLEDLYTSEEGIITGKLSALSPRKKLVPQTISFFDPFCIDDIKKEIRLMI